MKKTILSLFLSFAYLILNAQYQNNSEETKDNFFVNPIFSGDYPDPSILVDGSDYYIVHSSFYYYPGLTIWHSKDLINWAPVTSALTTYIGPVWAPDLVKYNNKYYIYFPVNNSNYVVVADAIDGPWSDPIDLKIGNIDPGHVVDQNGNRYLYFSNGGYVPLSLDGLSVTGDFQQVYNGWPIPREWTIECFCLEGPKLFKRGDYYYLTVAEGGTAGPATGHMVISARSKSPLGPWENSPQNPIIRAKSAEDKWWSVGHATIFEDANKNWWMMFHGYEKGHHNMGRQTLLAPIEWTKDGWYKLPEHIEIVKPIKMPLEKVKNTTFSLDDDFKSNQLNPQWKFFEEYDSGRLNFTNKGIEIQAKGNSIAESNPILCIPPDHSYIAQVEIEIDKDAIGGLVLYYNKSASSGILANNKDVLANLRGWQYTAEKDAINNHVFLRLKNSNNVVDMYYSLDGKNWTKIQSSLEVSALNHNAFGGFLSLRIGLVSLGNGKVKFKNYKYEAIK